MIWWLLAGWTALSACWWAVAAALVGTRRGSPQEEPDQRRLTVFKCVPAGAPPEEREHLAQCLETFAADLDDRSELLLGVPGDDRIYWRRWQHSVRRHHTGVTVTLVIDGAPDRLAANPKVSWMRLLAPHATGELWLWSDADIQAPPGTLRALRAEWSGVHARGGGALTCPYLVRQVSTQPALLDALYVNLEHFPGAALLDRFGTVRFAFGAGTLFEAAAFRRRVDWQRLGECLADDFHLGQQLAPVGISRTVLTTTAAAERWGGALLHYHRWRKTVRWCAPKGFAAELLVLPVLGWLAGVVLNPGDWQPWAGLAASVALDSLAGLGICALAGCRLSLRQLPALPVWSLVRPLIWLLCWLPVPIVWRGRRWWKPRQPESSGLVGA